MPTVQIRAIPASGFTARRRAGLYLDAKPIAREVVDTVTNPEKQITPAQLVALQSDPLVSVVPLDAAGGDPLALEASKAEIVRLTGELAEARRDFQGAVEELDRHKGYAAKQAEELGGRVMALTGELESMRAELARRAKK